jgi:hypothetical protein
VQKWSLGIVQKWLGGSAKVVIAMIFNSYLKEINDLKLSISNGGDEASPPQRVSDSQRKTVPEEAQNRSSLW